MRYTIPTNEVTVQPKIEPVGVEEVAANSPFVIDEDNLFIRDQLIPTARQFIEKLAVRSLITQTRAQYYDHMPCSPVSLRYGPVQSVNSFTYSDTDTTTATLASTYYDVDTRRMPNRLVVGYGDSWPTAICKTNSVAITYVAGYGSVATSVPIIYRRAIIILCTHWYENRDALGCEDATGVIGRLDDILAIEGRTVEYA